MPVLFLEEHYEDETLFGELHGNSEHTATDRNTGR